MEIIYEITVDDYLKFNLYHSKSNPALIKDYKQSRILLSIGLSFLLLLFVSFTFDSWIIGIILAAISTVVITLKYPNIHKKLIKQQIDNLLHYGDNSLLFCKKTMSINDDNIVIKSQGQTEILSRKISWDIKVYEDMILIYTNGLAAHIIPTRYLLSETKEKLLQELGIKS